MYMDKIRDHLAYMGEQQSWNSGDELCRDPAKGR